MPVNQKILFVSHDASKSGAPIILLTFLKWLKSNSNIEITILLKRNGDLYNEFCKVGKVFCWKLNTPTTIGNSLSAKIKRRLKKVESFVPFPSELEQQNFDLVYLNTIVSLDLSPLFKEKFSCPVIAHIHEMQYSIASEFSSFITPYYKQHIDHFIAVSQDVQQTLQQDYAIPATQISLVYEFINTQVIKQVTKTAEALRKEMDAKEMFIVGGSGYSIWRKGIDLFLYTAGYIGRYYPGNNIKFIWVGDINETYQHMINYETARLGIKDYIVFTGKQMEPNNYFQACDVFVCSSREDPFPLVCIEAAALGKPLLCFEQSGGMNEFINSGGGISVAYADVEAMANAIISLKNDRGKLAKLSEEALKNSMNYDVSVAAPKLFDIIKSFLTSLNV